MSDTPSLTLHHQFLRRKVAWALARCFWTVGLNRAGDHFEDVAFCGKRWLP